MSPKFTRTIAIGAIIGLGAASAAQAGIGDGVLGARAALTSASQVENAQFFFGGQNYCWYDAGWRGPGWYWCGYAYRTGLGWGGGDGFRGWRRGGGGHGGGGHGGAMPHGGAHFGGGGAHFGGGGAHFGGGGGAHFGGGGHGGGGHGGGGHGGGGVRKH
jgi:hypothetical protein